MTAAAPLLNAIVQIRTAATHDDPVMLRQQLVDEVRQFERRSKQAGLPFDMIIGARYCLCSVLDEAAGQTPWGSRSVWSGNGLLVTFHNESWGGEKVFQLLSRISQTPAQHLWLLEVINYCLLLGYEGRYRAMEQGHLQREAMRERLAQLIRDTRGLTESTPVPQPLTATSQNARWCPPVPLWVCITITAFIASLIYSAFNWQLNNTSGPLLRAIWQTPLPRMQPGKLSHASQALLDIRQRLDDLIISRQVDVTDTSNGSKVIIAADRLFREASTELTPRGRAIITRVSAAMDNIQGMVVVRVYTDDRPMPVSHFTSDHDISLAQARGISTLMLQIQKPGHVIRSEGLGNSNPLLPNDSDENRAQNRRVEIILFPVTVTADSQKDKS